MTDLELLQDALDALKHLCLHSAAIRGYDGEQVQTAIDALRARLAQPEQEPVVKLKELLEVQGRDCTWNYDPYFHGMYNGMEVMLAVLENREPVFRGAPKKWLSKKYWQGLMDEEINLIWKKSPHIVGLYTYTDIAKQVEAKLKEKNT